MTYVHINAPKPIRQGCTVLHCPTCERLRRMFYAQYEWYGTGVTCAGCGEEWNDGQRMPRPFAPGWRRKNIEHARAKLAALGVNA